MVKHAKTICRQFANESFDYFWPICEDGSSMVSVKPHMYLLISVFFHIKVLIHIHWKHQEKFVSVLFLGDIK